MSYLTRTPSEQKRNEVLLSKRAAIVLNNYKDSIIKPASYQALSTDSDGGFINKTCHSCVCLGFLRMFLTILKRKQVTSSYLCGDATVMVARLPTNTM